MSVFPWNPGRRPMTFHLSGWPRSSQYWRTSLTAESSASEPPLLKNDQLRPGGAKAERRAASRSAASFSKRIDWAKGSRRACSASASTRSSRPYPSATTPIPATASRYSLPVSSVTKTPLPETSRTYGWPMTGWMEWPTRFATVTSPSCASAVYDHAMYLNALEFLEEEREAWRPFEALDGLTDEQFDVPIDAAHDW